MNLGDTPEMQKDRAQYASANARRPPFVLRGDTISSSTFFTGVKMSEWANQSVKYHTGGKGNYVTTGMEDTGTLSSLQMLAKAGRVDWNRIMVLRTASDFDQPPPGMTAAQNSPATLDGNTSATCPRSNPPGGSATRWSRRSRPTGTNTNNRVTQ